MQPNFQRILLIKPSSLGDVIHALPVLHGLRKRYPEAKIDWLIASSFAPLIEGHEDVDELILFDRNRFRRLGLSPRATKAFMGFITGLRRRRYELAIDLQGLFRTGFFSWASRAPVRIGFSDAREGAWMFYNHKIPVSEKNTHAVDRNFQVASLLGFVDQPLRFDLPLTDEIRNQTRKILRDSGVDGSGVLVVVAPGARWETKLWGEDRFAATIDALRTADPSIQCVLAGAPSEHALCSQIANCCKTNPINLAGRTQLKQLVALIEAADVVLCHDSAAMHIAAALDRPLVCLTGPTNPYRTGPYQRIDDVIKLDLDCSPCYFRTLSQCPHQHRCMKDLTIESVVSALQSKLAGCLSAHH